MRLRIFLGLCAGLVYFLWWKSGQLPVAAPPPPERLEPVNVALTRERPDLMPEQAALLLLRREQEALPAAHALEPAGVSYTVTKRLDVALRHRLVFVPFGEQPVRMSEALRTAFSRFVNEGGVLVLQTPPGSPWTWLTGVEAASASRTRKKVSLRVLADPAFSLLKEPEQQSFLLGAPKPAEAIWTHGLSPASGQAEIIADFPETHEAAIVRRRMGKGLVYTLGFDLRDVVLRPQAQRHFDAQRVKYNGFEPAADVWPLFFRALYEHVNPFWARLSPRPGPGPFYLMTHTIGPGASLAQAQEFSRLESTRAAAATWFIQARTGTEAGKTAPLFDKKVRSFAAQLSRTGNAVASHGVSHGADFETLPFGEDPDVKSYRPDTDEEGNSEDATLRGETAVSKELLDSALSSGTVTGFRGPFFAYPPALDAVLRRAGYRYDSTFPAGSVLTHFPFAMLNGRSMLTEASLIEFPITFADELPEGKPADAAAMLALAAKISSYGGVVVWDIRPDGQASQLTRLAAVLAGAPKDARWLTMDEAERFWSRRRRADWFWKDGAGGAKTLRVSSPESVGGLSFELSRPVKTCRSKTAVVCSGAFVSIAPAVSAREAEIELILE